MKYVKKRDRYEASNVWFNLKDCKAASYNWWVFVAVIEGKTVFNWYTYSNSTSKHQRKVSNLISSLGVEIDVGVRFRKSLSDFSSLKQIKEFQKIQDDRDAELANWNRIERNRKARLRRQRAKEELKNKPVSKPQLTLLVGGVK